MTFENPTPKASEQESKRFYEETKVNGIEIEAGWDDHFRDYIIYFPQIEFNSELEDGVYDQILRISNSPIIAKKVFDYAANLAQTETDVREIYRKVEKFFRHLNNNGIPPPESEI